MLNATFKFKLATACKSALEQGVTSNSSKDSEGKKFHVFLICNVMYTMQVSTRSRGSDFEYFRAGCFVKNFAWVFGPIYEADGTNSI